MDIINIVLADDHILVRNGIKALLESEKNIIVKAEASDGEEALSVVEKNIPDVLIVDIRMPNYNGIEVIQKLKTKLPQVKTLVLSMHDSEEYVTQSVQAGADGYILKGASKPEFLKALYTVASGGKYFTGDVSSILINSFMNQKPSEATPQSTPQSNSLPAIDINLTKRQRQILKLVIEGDSNKDIGEKLNISKRTVEVHRFNLMKKLEVKNYSELLHKVQEIGLQL